MILLYKKEKRKMFRLFKKKEIEYFDLNSYDYEAAGYREMTEEELYRVNGGGWEEQAYKAAHEDAGDADKTWMPDQQETSNPQKTATGGNNTSDKAPNEGGDADSSNNGGGSGNHPNIPDSNYGVPTDVQKKMEERKKSKKAMSYAEQYKMAKRGANGEIVGYVNTVDSDYYYKILTSEKIKNMVEELHPAIKPYIKLTIRDANKKGIDFTINEAYRSFEEQDAIYNSERNADKSITNAKGGQSYHNYGLAVDFKIFKEVENKDGTKSKQQNWDFSSSDWTDLISIGESYGLTSGSRWTSPYDPPHFEQSYGYTTSQLNEKKKNGDVDSNGFVKL
ncbi:MAG: M15 family metallopeptidase [Treponema sp.]|nr:M15 family metallopeptidase [Treponema sp.]